MKSKKYVWVINGDIISNKVYSYPSQVRAFAKEKGFSIFDETYTDSNTIIFNKKDTFGRKKGFYASKYELV